MKLQTGTQLLCRMMFWLAGFLEVFVPWTILYKYNRSNSFVIVITCSIALQRYQTWYGYNYLNLIDCQASQKKDEVLVSLHRATSRDVARRRATSLSIGCQPITDKSFSLHAYSDWSIRRCPLRSLLKVACWPSSSASQNGAGQKSVWWSSKNKKSEMYIFFVFPCRSSWNMTFFVSKHVWW